MSGYVEIYRRSLERPEEFWAEAAEAIDWERRWDRVLDDRRPPFYRWFAGARLNTCWNALDRHVAAGRGERTALIWDSPVTGQVAAFTYRELRDGVARLAGALVGLGVGKGDRVLIYMPMVPEAAMAMLACARIGAVHSVVFGGFAAHELATRIDAASPRVVLSASCGIETSRIVPYKPLLDAAIAEARSKPEHCVILQRPMCRAELVAGRDHDWDELAAAARPADCVPVVATDPLYILYTSGTTGIPKGVVRDNGGHAVALCWSMRHIYGVEPDEVFWTASDVGWVVGHSYIVYAPLLSWLHHRHVRGQAGRHPRRRRLLAGHRAARGARVLYRADGVPRDQARRPRRRADPAPRSREIPRLVSRRRARRPADRRLGRAPSGRRGHRPLVADRDRLADRRQLPRHRKAAGQARLGDAAGPGLGCPRARRRSRGRGARMAAGEIGALAVKLPLPPGALPSLWEADDHFVGTYLSAFPGYYQTADAGFIDEDGYVHVMTRTDDIINVAGHRLSTGGIEEVLAAHPDVAECAVIGIADALKGQVPLGLLVLKAGAARSAAEIEREAVALVRERIGPVASFRTALVVAGLPKTRSGKILRGTMRKIADGEAYPMPATIDDPAVLDEISAALAGAGFSAKRPA